MANAFEQFVTVSPSSILLKSTISGRWWCRSARNALVIQSLMKWNDAMTDLVEQALFGDHIFQTDLPSLQSSARLPTSTLPATLLRAHTSRAAVPRYNILAPFFLLVNTFILISCCRASVQHPITLFFFSSIKTSEMSLLSSATWFFQSFPFTKLGCM